MPGGWGVAKIQHAELIPTQNHFSGIHTEYETEFAFSFEKSEVCSNVLQLILFYDIDNLIELFNILPISEHIIRSF